MDLDLEIVDNIFASGENTNEVAKRMQGELEKDRLGPIGTASLDNEKAVEDLEASDVGDYSGRGAHQGLGTYILITIGSDSIIGLYKSRSQRQEWQQVAMSKSTIDVKEEFCLETLDPFYYSSFMAIQKPSYLRSS